MVCAQNAEIKPPSVKRLNKISMEDQEMSADEYRALEGARLMKGLRETWDELEEVVHKCLTQPEE